MQCNNYEINEVMFVFYAIICITERIVYTHAYRCLFYKVVLNMRWQTGLAAATSRGGAPPQIYVARQDDKIIKY